MESEIPWPPIAPKDRPGFVEAEVKQYCGQLKFYVEILPPENTYVEFRLQGQGESTEGHRNSQSGKARLCVGGTETPGQLSVDVPTSPPPARTA